ncbi:hypothetical protein KR067_007826 [Drosophila pandora]|nr:hypothetical protein KR067_007826 [Drosophila pandora]
MQSHLIAVLLAFVAFSSCTASPQLLSAHLKMLDVMSATNEMQRNNPDQASACFNQYVSNVNDLSEAYKKEYDQCMNTRIEGTNGLLKEYDPLVESLASSSYQSCQAFYNCRNQNDSLNALNCLSVEGNDNSKSAYQVSSNATISAGILTQKIKDQDFIFELCANNSAIYFDNKSGVALIDFQNCLKGHDTWTTPSSSSSESSTEAPTTRTTPTTSTTHGSSSSYHPTTTTQRPSTISHFQSNDGKKINGWESKLDNIFNHILN